MSIAGKVAGAGEKSVKERDYWLNRLDGDLEKSVLPYDDIAGDDDAPTEAWAEVPFVFDGELQARLMKLSNGSEHRLHIILCAVTALFADRYTYNGSGDISMGAPILRQKKEAAFINTALVLRCPLEPGMNVKQLILRMRETIVGATEHVNYSMESLLYLLGIPYTSEDDFPLFDISVLVENIHEFDYLRMYRHHASFSFKNEANVIRGRLLYKPGKYRKETVERMVRHYEFLCHTVLFQPEMLLGDVHLLPEQEKQRILQEFNATGVDIPHQTIHGLFEAQVERTPGHPALEAEGEVWTYRQLDERADRVAQYLVSRCIVRPGDRVAVLMDPMLERGAVLFGILKAGGAYVPLDASLPERRLKRIIDDAGVEVIISLKRYLRIVNRLQWDCGTLATALYMDTYAVDTEVEEEESELMDRKLWEYIGENAENEVDGGGWTTSYDGEPFSQEEMDEYGDNILNKLLPLLNPRMRVLEIGCASGISMFRIAPRVGMYFGTDLSRVIIEADRERADAEGHTNIHLAAVPAQDIDTIDEGDFDLVIMNSVAQCFPGHNFFRMVLRKALSLMKPQGHIFIGDVMDRDLRERLVGDMKAYRREHRAEGVRTKTDFSAELFLSRAFFQELVVEVDQFEAVEFSPKIYTIENELTLYRYDALIHIGGHLETLPNGTVAHSAKDSPGRAIGSTSMVPAGGTRHGRDDLSVLERVPVGRVGAVGDLAYVIYTSGSTGEPKGVLVEHRGAANVLMDRRERYRLDTSVTALQLFGYGFDGFVTSFFTPLVSGAKVVVLGREEIKSVDRIREVIAARRVTHFISVPALFQAIISVMEAGEARSLRVVTLAGDRLPLEVIERAVALNPRLEIVNEYGITETSVMSTIFRHQEKSPYVRIGHPISNTQVYVVDAALRLQPVGVAGELCISGQGVARGYLNRPDLTAERFGCFSLPSPLSPLPSRFYKTGDLGRYHEDGAIEFLGRIDHQVKIRGFRIETGEIESKMLRHETVKEVVVLARGGEGGDGYLCAYYIPAGDDGLDTNQWNEVLAEELPEYMVPSYFVSLETFPLTPNGKLDRRALPEPSERLTGGRYVSPRNPLEEQLAGMWADVLMGDGETGQPIGIDTNFFQLGGHSLKATILVSRIHKELGVNVPLSEIFKRQTIRELGEYIGAEAAETFAAVRPVEQAEYYPLSSAQQRLFILHQIDGGDTAYNESAFMELQGSPHREKLETTFRRLIQRHESLRTSFHDHLGQLVQRVYDTVPFSIEYLESTAPRAQIIRSFVRLFDLSAPPLMRVALVKQEDHRYLLLVDMHHIITDGTSMGIIVKEFEALYQDRELPPLDIQYKDFAHWRNRQKGGENMRKQEAYWLARFRDDLPLLNLPFDFDRPVVQDFEGSRIDFTVEPERTRALKELGLKEDVTLYMITLAAYNVLLSKLSGQQDIILGTQIAGRRHADLQGIVGMFVNTLVLRAQPVAETSFLDFLKEIKTSTLEAYENQDYQFEDLVERVVLNRDPGRNPLFDAVFALHNVEMPDAHLPNLKIIPFRAQNPTAKFDLSLDGIETDGGLFFSMEYCSRLFKETTVQRFVQCYLQTLHTLLENPALPIGQMEIVPPADREKILFQFNRTRQEFDRTQLFHHRFLHQAARTPHAPAASHRETTITYAQLSAAAQTLSARFNADGIRPGHFVALYMPRGIDMLTAIIATFLTGAAYLPLEPEYPEDRVHYILQNSETTALVTDEALMPIVERIKPELPELRSVYASGGQNPFREKGSALPKAFDCPTDGELGTADALAYLIYTSGTTGQPKGVMVHHLGMMNHLFAKINDLQIAATDIIAQTASACFDISVWQYLAALVTGGKTVIIDKETVLEPRQLLRHLQTRNITVLETVPSLMAAFLEMAEQEQDNRLSSLRWMVPTGEALGVHLARRWYRLYPGIKQVNAYGPTEASDDVTHYILDHIPGGDWKTIPVGKPLQNLHIHILDPALNLCPIGVRGEICVAGIGVGKGYLDDPEKTARHFVPNPYAHLFPGDDYRTLYRTGDIGYYREDGHVECLGRLDFQVKIRGYRIELEEIENRLLSHPGVKEAVVSARSRGGGEKYLCAYVVPLAVAEGEAVSVSSLRDFLAGHLPGYMVPAYFIMLENMPLSVSGKVDRKRLPEPGAAHAALDADYAAPGDPLEEKLVKIWAEVLEMEVSALSIDGDFFQLGGHSLKAVRMAGAVRKELGVPVPLAEIFKTPTVRGLARYIRDLGDITLSAVTAGEEREVYPLSASQRRMYVLNLFMEYNMPFVLELKGELDTERFEDTFKSLIKRHEALRTSFHLPPAPALIAESEEEPRQRVHDDVPFALAVFSSAAPDVVSRFFQPFDLTRAPLMRVGLAPLDGGGHLLLFNIHHIISDGVSLEVLVKEFSRLYRGEDLPVPSIRYRDFALWQHERTRDGAYDEAGQYWSNTFSGSLPVLHLPTDYPRPEVQRFEGGIVRFHAGEMETAALRRLAAMAETSLFTLLMAGYAALLHRYTGQDDLVVGTVTAGREEDPQLQELLGVFMNPLALRYPVEGQTPFRDFLPLVKNLTLEAFRHQAYPFDRLLEQAAETAGSDLSRNPLFDAMLIMQAREVFDFQIEGIDVSFYDISRHVEHHAQHDMTLWVVEEPQKVSFDLEYRTSLFKPRTMERFSRHLLSLLSNAAADPGLTLDRIPILSAHEHRRVMEEFNATETAFPPFKPFHMIFLEQAQRVPHAVAVSAGEASLTYGELSRRARVLGMTLKEKGLSPGTVAPVIVGRSAEMFIAVLGVLMVGGAYLPIDPALPEERVKYILADCGAEIVVDARMDGEQGRTDFGADVVCLEGAMLGDRLQTCPYDPEDVGGDGWAYVIYTSGTTGRPKGVVVSHGQWVNAAWAWRREYRLDNMEVRLLQMAGFSFDVFAGDLARAFIVGGRIVSCPAEVRVHPDQLHALMLREKIALLEATPALLVPLMDYIYDNPLSTGALRLLILGSDNCPVTDFRRLWERFADKLRIINSYGVTEATIDSSYYEAPGSGLPQLEHVPIGKPMPNTRYFILGPGGLPQPVGVPGELFIGGSGVSLGYLNNPGLTAERFVCLEGRGERGEGRKNKNETAQSGTGSATAPVRAEGPIFSLPSPLSSLPSRFYKTGDLARWLPDGNVQFLGRVDFQVKIRGFRVEPGEIENSLMSHPDVKETVVVARTDARGELMLCAYAVLHPGKELPGTVVLRDHLSMLLPDVMVPASFTLLEALPLTPGGKVDRRALPAPETPVSASVAVPPRDGLQRTLLDIWREVLMLADDVEAGIDHNFFQLGGHSLKAARLTSLVHQRLDVRVSMEVLFRSSTVRRLAEYIREAGEERFEAIPLLEEREYYPLSPAQERIWVMCQSREASVAFNMQDAYTIEGKVDEGIFQAALQAVIERHESLRTGFHLVDGRPVQKICRDCFSRDKQPGGIFKKAARLTGGIDPVRRVALNELDTPFELSMAPLLRVVLLPLEGERWVLLLTMHHSISDGVSLQVFFDELVSTYTRLAAGGEVSFAPLAVQYKEYASWQRRLTGRGDAGDESPGMKRHRDYWLSQLGGVLPVLELPDSGSRPGRMTYAGDTVNFSIDDTLSRRLNTLARACDASLFMVLTALLKTLFYQVTGQVDQVVGTTMDGRDHAGLEGQIGFYINTLALRTRFSPGDTFYQLLANVRNVLLSAYEHRHYPFDRLVEELRAPRHADRHPVFDIVVDMINYRESRAVNPGSTLKILPFRPHQDSSKFDFTVYIFEGAETLDIRFEYKTAIFDPPFMERLSHRFQRLLERVTDTPGRPLSRLVAEPVPPVSLYPAADRPGLVEAPEVEASFHQERLWFIHRFEAGNLYEAGPVYHNIPSIVRWNGPLSCEALEAGIREVMLRHRMTRTRVITRENRPYERTVSGDCFNLELLELTGEKGTYETAFSCALDVVSRPFELDAENQPLLRGLVVRWAEGKHLFVLTLHHILADRASVEIITGEVLRVYNGRLTGEPVEFSGSTVDYREISRCRREMPPEVDEASMFYWRRRLRSGVEPLLLPTDQPRAGIHVYRAARQEVALPAALTASMENLCIQLGISMTDLLLTVFALLLHRYTGQEEIVVGTPVPLRDTFSSGPLVAPLDNLVVLRHRAPGGITGRELAGQVKRTLAEAVEHASIPFDRLVTQLNHNIDMSRTALFDVLFHYLDTPLDLPKVEGLQLEPIETNLGWGKYDLNLFLRRDTENISGVLTYNALYFDAATAERMSLHFLQLLEALLREPGAVIDALPMVGGEERRLSVEKWNSTSCDYPRDRTVIDLFEAAVAGGPGRVALVFEDLQVTYSVLDGLAGVLAGFLEAEYGVRDNDLVAVTATPGVEMIVMLLGILKTGAAYVPIDPNYPEERKTFIINDSACKLVLTPELCASGLESQSGRVPAPRGGRVDDVAYIIYTSGTTGKPKGCMVTHRNVVRLLKNEKFPFDFNPDDIWIMAHSFCFDVSVWEMYGALFNLGRLVLPAREAVRDTEQFLELLHKHSVTVLNQTPGAFYQLSGLLERNRDSRCGDFLRCIVFAGDRLEPAYLRPFRELFPGGGTRLINMYGITETTVHVTFYELTEADIYTTRPESPIGGPLPETVIYILNPALRLQPVGVAGEMYVGGSGVARGYLNRPELTAERFVFPDAGGNTLPSPLYRSGDLAKRLPNGDIMFLGRIDHQVKIRGYRIELGEIRNRLTEHDAVREAVVIDRLDDGGDRYLCGYVVLAGPVKPAELARYLSSRLPGYMVPAFIVPIPAVPLTPNGKLDRAALPEPRAAVGEGETEQPRDETGRRLAALFAEVLGIPAEAPGAAGDFFKLGGHSLKAALLTARIHETFQVKVPLSEVFSRRTVRALAQYISGAELETFKVIPPAEEREYYPLTPAQRGVFVQQRLRPQSTVYNILHAVKIRGNLDPERLETAVREMIRRHQSFRTSFLTLGAEPVQRVHTTVEPASVIIDIPPAPDGSVETVISQFVRPFDLSCAPLLRVGVLVLDSETRVFLADMHHLITDGVSHEVFVRELVALYAGEALAPLEVQYRDYTLWLYSEAVDRRTERQGEYWSEQMSGPLPRAAMPTDFPRPAQRKFRGEIVYFALEPSLSAQLKQLTAAAGVTINMVLLAAFHVFFVLYTGSEDVLTGSPVTGRTHGGLRDIIGMFVNMLALRTRPQGDKTFLDYLAEVKDILLGAMEHQEYPFDRLVPQLGLQGDAGRNPLFDVVFAMQNIQGSREGLEVTLPEGNVLCVEPFEFGVPVAQFDLILGAEETGEVFTLSLRYDIDLWRRDSIDKMIERYTGILEQITGAPDILLKEITVSSGLLSADTALPEDIDDEFEL